MALRIIVVALVVAFAAGSLLYTFTGSSGGGAAKKESNVQFDLPKKTAAEEETGKPLVLDTASIPEIIAEINGKPLKKDAYVRSLEAFKKNMERSGNPISQSRFEAIKGMMLDNFINSEVLLQQAEKEGLKVDDAEVEKNLDLIKKNFPNEEAFQSTLKEQGLNVDEIKKDLRKNLLIQMLVNDKVLKNIKITDEEVRKHYDLNQLEFEQPERVRASHILIRFDPNGAPEQKAEAKKKIEEIIDQLKQGADFGMLASKYSEDPGSKAQGGDLGFFPRGRMVPAFEKAAFETEPGQLSDIVESQFGYHVIKVFEKRPAGVESFEEAKPRIEAKLKREKTQKEVRVYVGKLREEMNVKKLL